MMNYDEFKEAFIKSFEDYINENYSNYVINTESVLKNNITLDGLSLRREGDKIAPVVYLNYLYEDYISGKEIKDLVEHISQMMIDSITNKNDLVKDVSMSDFTYDYCKDKIVFNICNSQLNQDILDKRPNRAFNDLSITYKVLIGKKNDITASVPIDNNLAQHIGINEEQLYQLAYENTKILMPTTINSMDQVIDFNQIDIDSNDILEQDMLWVISNSKKFNGASAMLYTEDLSKLADKLDADLYIIPSSVDEVLAVSAKSMIASDVNYLKEMVSEVNKTLEPEMLLSNEVYTFDKQSHKITIAESSSVRNEDKSFDDIPFKRKSR